MECAKQSTIAHKAAIPHEIRRHLTRTRAIIVIRVQLKLLLLSQLVGQILFRLYVVLIGYRYEMHGGLKSLTLWYKLLAEETTSIFRTLIACCTQFFFF